MIRYNYTRDNLPDDRFSSDYVKKRVTRMWRVTGPFRVETREGPVICEDGWLAVDAHGWPYPIADDEQREIYDPV